jgi:hypothetical protein
MKWQRLGSQIAYATSTFTGLRKLTIRFNEYCLNNFAIEASFTVAS